MPEQHWPSEWLRGVLELCVLAVLAQAPAHGYAVAQQLAEAGLGAVKGGTLYPLLTRLEADGYLAASWQAGDGGPGRKVFAITADGQLELARRRELWGAFGERVSAVLTRSLNGVTP